MSSEHEQLYDVQGAAKLLGVTPSTIRRWAQKGSLKGIKVGPRGDWRFTKEDLEKMIKKT